MEEFFKDTNKAIEKLKDNGFEEDEINSILQFINFDKVIIEERELILFTRDDKLMLLHHFPEIKELYEKQNFGKFNDRKHEEAIFWNDFFMNQQNQNSFISGKGFDNLKVKETVSDFISKKLEKSENTLELNLNENFEDLINIQNEEKYLNVPKIEQTNVLNNINNYSLSILYKNLKDNGTEKNFSKNGKTNGLSKKMKELKIDDSEFEEFQLFDKMKKEKKNEIILEPVSPLKRRNSFTLKSPKKEKNASDQQFTLYYRKYISKISKRVKERISENSIDMFFENNQENNKIVIASINEQISKQLNSDEMNINTWKTNYVSGFFDKYESLNDNLKILLNIFYKLFPIDIEKNGKQIVNIAKKLQSIKNDIKEFKRKLQPKLNSESVRIHYEPLENLEKLIICAFEKIKELI